MRVVIPRTQKLPGPQKPEATALDKAEPGPQSPGPPAPSLRAPQSPDPQPQSPPAPDFKAPRPWPSKLPGSELPGPPAPSLRASQPPASELPGPPLGLSALRPKSSPAPESPGSAGPSPRSPWLPTPSPVPPPAKTGRPRTRAGRGRLSELRTRTAQPPPSFRPAPGRPDAGSAQFGAALSPVLWTTV